MFLSRLLSVGVVAALSLALVAPAAPARAAGPAGYGYATEWIYSTVAAEVPDAVATDAAGRVFVIGSNAGYGDDKSTVRIYDPQGSLQNQWEVDFPNIGDMTIDPAGNVLVADYSGNIAADIPAAIDVYRPDGTYQHSYAMRPCCDVNETAGGIGVGANGRLYVASPTSDQVIVYNADGTRHKVFGGTGTAPGQLKSPWGLDVAPDGRVVVADRSNDRVQVFSAEGDYLTGWGQAGTGPGQFAGGPDEVLVRADGTVYVTDGTSRVQVFTLAGQYLGTIPTATKRAGDTMSATTSLAFGPGQELYVSGKLYPFENGVAKYVPAGAGAGVAKVKAPKKGVKVAKKKVKLTVRCVSATPCSGTLTLSAKGKQIAKPKAYSVPAGGKAKVKAKLTKKGLKVVRKKPVTKVTATVAGGSKKVKVRR